MSTFYNLTVKEISKETPNAVSIVFEVPSNLRNEFTFEAGQYITLKTTIEGEEIRRAYSICSIPKSDEFRIVVKAVKNGKFSQFATTKLTKGAKLEVAEPEGRFILKANPLNKNSYLGIAAGSGITPVMGILKTVLAHEPNSSFHLIYGNQSNRDTIFYNDLITLSKQYPNRFTISFVFSREKNENALFGRIDKGNLNYLLKNNFASVELEKVYLCGPENMIQTAKETLTQYNVKEENILYELFSSPIASIIKPETKFEGNCEISVVLDDEETSFTMPTKSTILTAVLKEGIDAPYSCQGGICSSCLAKVTEGKAVMEKNTILSDEEVNEGFILTCQAHPVSQKIKVNYDEV